MGGVGGENESGNPSGWVGPAAGLGRMGTNRQVRASRTGIAGSDMESTRLVNTLARIFSGLSRDASFEIRLDRHWVGFARRAFRGRRDSDTLLVAPRGTCKSSDAKLKSRSGLSLRYSDYRLTTATAEASTLPACFFETTPALVRVR